MHLLGQNAPFKFVYSNVNWQYQKLLNGDLPDVALLVQNNTHYE